MGTKQCWKRTLSILCLVAIMGNMLSACDSTEEWELVEAEITRTGKYSLGYSTAGDDTTMDFIDLEIGNTIENMQIERNNFYRLRAGDIIKVRRSPVQDGNVTYQYLESDNFKDIDSVDLESRTEITSLQVDAKITAKKTYLRGKKHIKSVFILDTESGQMVTLHNIPMVWDLIKTGDTVKVQRDTMKYNGETYYHYYILYEEN